ncbi:MAG: citrate synthase [Chloroflexota bacterium]|nr:citrate synthase [Chloroflexota bacterium]
MAAKESGLRGVVAGRSALSSVDGEVGRLTYRGIDIADLVAAETTFEEVAYLLWHDELPSRSQLDALTNQLNESRGLPGPVMDMLASLPDDSTPMVALRTAVSMLGSFDPDQGDDSLEAAERKAVRLLAQTPNIVAQAGRLLEGRDPIDPPDGSIAESFLATYFGEAPKPEATRTIDVMLVLQADHEFNASTFAARVIAATLTDMHSAIAGAVGALRGPLHGGANQAVLEMLLQVTSPEEAEAWVLDKLAKRELVMGFGHAVYRTADPRATILREIARELAPASGHAEWFETSQVMEAVMLREKNLNSNVDFYAATVYASLGIPPDLFTPIFAISRMSGWTAHVLEQQGNNRIIRPRAEYVGHMDRPVTPMAERG